jgi:hypothetical protein
MYRASITNLIAGLSNKVPKQAANVLAPEVYSSKRSKHVWGGFVLVRDVRGLILYRTILEPLEPFRDSNESTNQTQRSGNMN